MIRVDHQADVGTDRIADSLDQRDITLRANANLHLHRLVAGFLDRRTLIRELLLEITVTLQHHAVAVDLDALTESATEQLVHGLVEDLACDIHKAISTPDRDWIGMPF